MSDYPFTPRLDDSGMLNNPYWYSGNPFWQAQTTPPHDYGLPNCTCYSWGRVWSILAESGAYADPRSEVYNNLCPHFGNAYTWDTDTRWTLSQEPALGAVAVYDTTDSAGTIIGTPGHVAVVEEIIDQNTITLSESHYNQTYFDTRTATRANGWADGYLLKFKAFIILPISITPGVSDDLIILLASMLRKKKRKKGGLI